MVPINKMTFDAIFIQMNNDTKKKDESTVGEGYQFVSLIPFKWGGFFFCV